MEWLYVQYLSESESFICFRLLNIDCKKGGIEQLFGKYTQENSVVCCSCVCVWMSDSERNKKNIFCVFSFIHWVEYWVAECKENQFFYIFVLSSSSCFFLLIFFYFILCSAIFYAWKLCFFWLPPLWLWYTAVFPWLRKKRQKMWKFFLAKSFS